MLVLMLVGVIGYLVLLPFKRRIGRINYNTGLKGSSENAFIPVVWVLAAIVTGIYMSR